MKLGTYLIWEMLPIIKINFFYLMSKIKKLMINFIYCFVWCETCLSHWQENIEDILKTEFRIWEIFGKYDDEH